ncbi:MAG: undecaprenyl/decaprenyl-phosphate alpha-N-acetylglucosaminyl 1-phosphate transferase [Chloroflexi bacterium]|nr:undecaprenyl/decaprenyl-phosphate alpha-N-acetylglucosaminyl 1-phosphate transferase [Chloroflexota bacterium]MDA8188171.1 MraY family glycosyltransferase [Dehalococcoidales bacterium]
MLLYFLAALVFLIAFASSLALVPMAGKLGIRLGFIDKPRPGELQKKPIARTGGYAIFMAFMLALAVSLVIFPRFADEYSRLLGLILGALLILPIAYLDDFKRMGPLPQMAGQIVVALVAMSFGLILDNFASPFGGIVSFPLFVAIPVTLFWYVGMINTLNFIDTMDGLAAGVTTIAAAILFIRAADLGQYSIAVLVLALAGACLGFLPYNLHPARIFMGTSGSMFLGYMLATLGIIGGAKVATTILVLGIPILDTALVIARRLLAGRSPFKGGDSAHLPHRLLAVGIPQPLIVFLLYVFCLVLGYFALALSAIQKLYAFGAMGLALGIAVTVIAYRSRATAGEE